MDQRSNPATPNSSQNVVEHQVDLTFKNSLIQQLQKQLDNQDQIHEVSIIEHKDVVKSKISIIKHLHALLDVQRQNSAASLVGHQVLVHSKVLG